MKAINIFFILLFLMSAALQFNDPDPYLWVPIYLYGALICFLAVRKIFYPALYVIGLTSYSVYAIYIFFKTDGVLSWMKDHHGDALLQTMQASSPWIENTREFFGLVLLIVVLWMNFVAGSKGIRTRI